MRKGKKGDVQVKLRNGPVTSRVVACVAASVLPHDGYRKNVNPSFADMSDAQATLVEVAAFFF
jgi:hypothetical protein